MISRWATVVLTFLALLALVVLGTSCSRDSPTIPDPPPRAPTPGLHWPFGVVVCCDDPLTAVDEGIRDGWTLATPEALEKMAHAGATMTHFRTGPYVLGSPEARAVEGLREAVQAANSFGIRPEIDLIDNWALVNGVNAWGDSCKVTQQAPQERHLVHIREVVLATKDFDVTYNLGNEGDRCSPAKAWDLGLYGEVKKLTSRPVGSNSGLGIGDYVTVHGFSPTSNGTILTESDNRDHTPEEWYWLYRESEKRKGYVMLWFGPMKDSDRERLLAMMSSTTGAECFAPDPEDPNWGRKYHRDSMMIGMVRAAQLALGDRCGEPWQETLAELAKLLRFEGYCASGPWADALVIKAPDGLWEEMHAVEVTGGCYTTTNTYKGAWKYS